MHQPQYRDLIAGVYQLPWTYLHTVKDYVDMVAHLEAEPRARAVVNFAPVLLEQIDDYGRQVAGFLSAQAPIRDPLLAALASPALPVDPGHRLWLLRACQRANRERLVNRFPAYRRLLDLGVPFIEHPDALSYLSDQFLVDLLVWYHLAWLGETVRRQDARVQALIEQEGGYSLHDRRLLLTVIGELLSGVLGRYRALAEQGRVELAMSPYGHPILPLLLDFGSARDAMPEVEMPGAAQYPAGEERARWHIDHGLAAFDKHFGRHPRGCWPSEGSLSVATVRLLDQYGFQWCASGEGVLRNSLARAGHSGDAYHRQPLYRPYRLEGTRIACFFRDDGLSDLIGFTYSDWHADDAVANLLHHLRHIADTGDTGRARVVSIVLDGENAWEHYPENGYYLLSGLYRALADEPRMEMTTFAECLDQGLPDSTLPTLVAGSWVYGTFSTWIGDSGKNRGWDMLVDARRAHLDSASWLARERREAVDRQLAVCEGSDWFWWFGDYNPADVVGDFERLYREHLANLYQMLGREPPGYLSETFTRGHGAPEHGGVMRRGRDYA
jgi:alpha-amylase/alpha-mannosidase (GH57 family)